MFRNILIIKVNNRSSAALTVQEILTKYGCIIKSRLGLHELQSDNCKEEGLIILELLSDKDKQIELNQELNKLNNLKTFFVEL